MKNLENNQRYNYRDREEEKKKKKSQHLLWLLLLLCFFVVALIIVIAVGFTQSWYSFTQKMEGDFEFEQGIVMNYENILVSEGSTFALLKTENGKLSALNESTVRFDDKYTILNPNITAETGSVDFFIRAKCEYTFTKMIGGELKTLNLEQLADALNEERGTTIYNKNNVLSAVFDKTLEFDSTWKKSDSDWYYYAGNLQNWSNSSNTPNYEDMQSGILTSKTPSIKVFKEDGGKVEVQIIAGSENHMETFLIKSCKITLTFNACEATEEAFNDWITIK